MTSFVANADGTGWTGLTGDIFDHIDYGRPSWSADSAKLAVTMTEPIGVDHYITQLGVMNADGSGLTPLISAATWAKSSWSPDAHDDRVHVRVAGGAEHFVGQRHGWKQVRHCAASAPRTS